MKNTGSLYRFLMVVTTLLLLDSFLFNPTLITKASNSNPLSISDSTNAQKKPVQVNQSTPEGIILELNPAKPQFQAGQVGGQPCQTISIIDLNQNDSPGFPSLPVQGTMLGIPADGQPEIQILTAEYDNLPGSYDLCPSMQPMIEHSDRQPWKLTGYKAVRGPEYQVDAFLPATPAELVTIGNIRSQRFAEIRFNPIQYNPVTGVLRYYSHIQIEVKFGSINRKARSQSSPVSEGYFEDSLKDLLVNYEQARNWRSQPAHLSQPETVTAPQSDHSYKIMVDKDGLYMVSYADLLAAEIPAEDLDNLDPHTFQLFNQGTEVAIYVEGETDNTFNTTDYFLFYGQKINTKYTDTNVYWLTWGSTNGLRMDTVDPPTSSTSVPVDFLTTQHMEQNIDYYFETPSGPDHDHWYWGIVAADAGPAYLDFQTDLHYLGAGSHTATVRGLLAGYTSYPNHHTKIYLNGHLIDDHLFTTGSEYSFTVNVPQSYLLEGTNNIRVECPLDGGINFDYVLVNWFEIDYYRIYTAQNNQLFFDGNQAGNWKYQIDGFSSTSLEAFDITEPQNPISVTNSVVNNDYNEQQLSFETMISSVHHYFSEATSQRLSPVEIIEDNPSNLKSPSQGADYIIISHADFLNQVQPLADFRASQGLRVKVVDVQDIYDEFNGGVFNPEAIQSFLAYAYDNWTAPAPSFVLLVGDGNFDYKNYYGWDNPIYIPPYLADVDPWISETATDNRYVSVSGDDILPDMYIGRFPVNSPEEAQTMVEKTIHYEQASLQEWNKKLIFIADNTDGAGNFSLFSDQIISTYLPAFYAVDKVYYGSADYPTINSTRTALQNAINQGRLIVHYAGHGITQQWGSEGFLKVTDLASLTNGSILPMMLPFACSEGYFIWPSPVGYDYSGLAESIVRINGRGAIASWSTTGYGLSVGHDILDRSFFSDLFKSNQSQIGYLTTHAKYVLFANTSLYDDQIETYHLFGDPALKLKTLQLHFIFVPSVR